MLSESSYVTAIPVSVLERTIAPTVSAMVSARVTPAIVNASVSNVPSISTSPEISKSATTVVPVKVGAVRVLLVNVCVAFIPTTGPHEPTQVFAGNPTRVSVEVISASPNLIVEPARYRSLNFFVEEPRSYDSSVSGIRCPAIVVAPKVLFVNVVVDVAVTVPPPSASEPTHLPVVELYFRNLSLTFAVDSSTSSNLPRRTSPPPAVVAIIPRISEICLV